LPPHLGRWRFNTELDFRSVPQLRGTAVSATPGFMESAGRKMDARVRLNAVLTTAVAIFKLAGASGTEVQSLHGHSRPAVMLKVCSHWMKNVETDSVDRLAKSLTTSPKNLGYFLDTLEVAPRANTA
jgi:hypothetical protein